MGAACDQRVEIALGVLGPVLEAGSLALAVARYPEGTGRGRSGTAGLVRLLAQEHIQAFERGDQRRRHSGRPRTCNEQIDFPFGNHVTMPVLSTSGLG